jgi:hypothetical protein
MKTLRHMIHADTKQLARFQQSAHRLTDDRCQGRSGVVGYEMDHVGVDDATRLVCVEVLPDACCGLLQRALDHLKPWSHG